MIFDATETYQIIDFNFSLWVIKIVTIKMFMILGSANEQQYGVDILVTPGNCAQKAQVRNLFKSHANFFNGSRTYFHRKLNYIGWFLEHPWINRFDTFSLSQIKSLFYLNTHQLEYIFFHFNR